MDTVEKTQSMLYFKLEAIKGTKKEIKHMLRNLANDFEKEESLYFLSSSKGFEAQKGNTILQWSIEPTENTSLHKLQKDKE